MATVTMDGAATLLMNGDGDVRLVSDDGWRLEGCCFLFYPLAPCIVLVIYLKLCRNMMFDDRLVENSHP